MKQKPTYQPFSLWPAALALLLAILMAPALMLPASAAPADADHVLFVTINGAYNADGVNAYNMLVAAGADADHVVLNVNGNVAAAINAAALDGKPYNQIWVYDLSTGADNYPSDYAAIVAWFNSRPAPELICDGRFLSSYWSGRWNTEGRALAQNYYTNLAARGGGLLLATDHYAYSNSGISNLTNLLGINRFSGEFGGSFPVDSTNPLMTTPNNLTGGLFNDSTTGQAPFNLQPNGLILHTVGYHSGNTLTPGISSTIGGSLNFTVAIDEPASGQLLCPGDTVLATTSVNKQSDPVTYNWSSNIDGPLGTAGTQLLEFASLSEGAHTITVLAKDAANLYDNDSIRITVGGLDCDTDGDGVADGSDNCPALNNPDQANFDNDSQGDACDPDDDNDGLSDVDEAAAGANPFNPDTDDDTVGDNSDSCPPRGPTVAVVSNDTPLCPAPAGAVTAAGAAAPIAVNLHGQSSFGVPVRFAANGPQISSVDFKLDYDETCIAFDDTTDVNNDGLPDALVSLPASHVTSFQHNAGTGDLTLIIAPPNNTPPLPLLADGALVTVNFNVLPACVTNDGATKTLNFVLSNQHYGNDQGQAVNGTTLVEDYELRFNANPTDIALANSSVNENVNNATVGALDSSDVDETAPRPGDSHTYALVNSGCGAATDYTADNGAFQISGANLLTKGSLDFEAQPSYTVCLRSTDSYGGAFEKEFTISVNDLNEAPTSLDLSNASVNENEPVGAVVGNLSTTDEDLIDDGAPPAGSIVEVHTYSLPAGQLDNAQFQIVGNQLQTNAVFDHETKNTYNVRIRTTDSANQSFERVYTISITNVNDAPVANDDPASPPLIVLGDGHSVTIDVLANDTDQDNDGLSVSALNTAGTLGSVTNNGTNVSYKAPQDTNSADSFGYTITDDNALGPKTASATVNLYVVADDARADCNSDGAINAADFPALVLEIFDTDAPDSHTWWRIFEQGFNGSPLGCDANASRNGVNNNKPSVNAADIICTVLVFFGNDSCTQPGVQAASAADVASLSAPQNLAAAAGEEVAVDLTLNTGANSVAAATFALALDTSKVTFDATDANEDGVPDAITFNAPASMTKSVTWNAEQSRIEVALFGATLPLPTLSDGVLATVTLDVAGNASGDAPLTLDLVSLGDDRGADVEVNDVDGLLRIGGNGDIYLPIVTR
ncbi:MAG: Ig-like domain-containing protein [Caldilineaceae bacterium]